MPLTNGAGGVPCLRPLSLSVKPFRTLGYPRLGDVRAKRAPNAQIKHLENPLLLPACIANPGYAHNLSAPLQAACHLPRLGGAYFPRLCGFPCPVV
jgi:hypothetical protein